MQGIGTSPSPRVISFGKAELTSSAEDMNTVTMPMTIPPLMTAEEILTLDISGKSTELVHGHLVVREPPSTYHGRLAARLLFRLGQHVYENDLGDLCGQDTGFHIFSNPDTVRAPDVAFIRKERCDQITARGYAKLAPDLVVEIISPGDRASEVLARVGDWLQGGASIIWVIDPERRTAQVYRADGSVALIGNNGALNGEDVLPGWQCSLEELLR